MPDLTSVVGMNKKTAEDYAKNHGFILPSVEHTQRTAAPNEYTNRVLKDINGIEHLPMFIYTLMLDGSSLDWAKRHISKNTKDFRYTFSTPGAAHRKLGPHCDRSRWYSMMYLIESGGCDHYTAFYREKGTQEIEREFGYHIDDYSMVEEIHRIVIPLNQWVLINARVLHSVENITGTRIAFHISFNEFPQDIALKKPIYF